MSQMAFRNASEYVLTASSSAHRCFTLYWASDGSLSYVRLHSCANTYDAMHCRLGSDLSVAFVYATRAKTYITHDQPM